MSADVRVGAAAAAEEEEFAAEGGCERGTIGAPFSSVSCSVLALFPSLSVIPSAERGGEGTGGGSEEEKGRKGGVAVPSRITLSTWLARYSLAPLFVFFMPLLLSVVAVVATLLRTFVGEEEGASEVVRKGSTEEGRTVEA